MWSITRKGEKIARETVYSWCYRKNCFAHMRLKARRRVRTECEALLKTLSLVFTQCKHVILTTRAFRLRSHSVRHCSVRKFDLRGFLHSKHPRFARDFPSSASRSWDWRLKIKTRWKNVLNWKLWASNQMWPCCVGTFRMTKTWLRDQRFTEKVFSVIWRTFWGLLLRQTKRWD